MRQQKSPLGSGSTPRTQRPSRITKPSGSDRERVFLPSSAGCLVACQSARFARSLAPRFFVRGRLGLAILSFFDGRGIAAADGRAPFGFPTSHFFLRQGRSNLRLWLDVRVARLGHDDTLLPSRVVIFQLAASCPKGMVANAIPQRNVFAGRWHAVCVLLILDRGIRRGVKKVVRQPGGSYDVSEGVTLRQGELRGHWLVGRLAFADCVAAIAVARLRALIAPLPVWTAIARLDRAIVTGVTKASDSFRDASRQAGRSTAVGDFSSSARFFAPGIV